MRGGKTVIEKSHHRPCPGCGVYVQHYGLCNGCRREQAQHEYDGTALFGVLLVAMVVILMAGYFIFSKTRADRSVANDVKRIADVMEGGCKP